MFSGRFIPKRDENIMHQYCLNYQQFLKKSYTLKNFMDKSDLISRSKYGFRKNHNTNNAILDIYNCILENKKQNKNY